MDRKIRQRIRVSHEYFWHFYCMLEHIPNMKFHLNDAMNLLEASCLLNQWPRAADIPMKDTVHVNVNKILVSSTRKVHSGNVQQVSFNASQAVIITVTSIEGLCCYAPFFFLGKTFCFPPKVS